MGLYLIVTVCAFGHALYLIAIAVMGKVYGNDFYAVILAGKCKSLRRKLKSQEQSCQKPCRTFHSSHVPPSCLSQVMVIFLVYSFEIHLPYAAVSLSLTAFFSRKATRFA